MMEHQRTVKATTTYMNVLTQQLETANIEDFRILDEPVNGIIRMAGPKGEVYVKKEYFVSCITVKEA